MKKIQEIKAMFKELHLRVQNNLLSDLLISQEPEGEGKLIQEVGALVVQSHN